MNLNSLGVNTLEKYGLKNHKEASDLTEVVKQMSVKTYRLIVRVTNRLAQCNADTSFTPWSSEKFKSLPNV